MSAQALSSTNEMAQLLQLSSDTEILQCVRGSIGEGRFKRICSRQELSSYSVSKEEEHCSRSFLKIFMTCLFDIQKQDIDEVGGDAVEAYKKLIPFSTFAEFKKVFLGEGPRNSDFIIDKVASSGKGLIGLAERVFVNAQHHFFVETDATSEAADFREYEMLSSRFIDREIPVGTVVHLNKGIFYVEAQFVRQGAFVDVLRDIEGKEAPKILCRGTAFRRGATSGMASGFNDMLPEIGSLGVMAIWPELSRYLLDQGIQSVEIVGKSLGGAVAQKLAILIEGLLRVNVNHLITVNSVGVGDEVNTLFKGEILQKRSDDRPFKITILRNGGDETRGDLDYIPILGGVHLGANASPNVCARRVVTLCPHTSKQDSIPNDLYFFTYARRLQLSLQTSHCRQTTLEPFSYTVVQNAEEVNLCLEIGNLFEHVRRSGAFLVKYLTFSYFDQHLNDFFAEQKILSIKNP